MGLNVQENVVYRTGFKSRWVRRVRNTHGYVSLSQTMGHAMQSLQSDLRKFVESHF